MDEPNEQRLRALIEAILFASPEPVPVSRLAKALQQPEHRVRTWIEQLSAAYDTPAHGISIQMAATGYQIRTKPDHKDALQEILRGLRPRAPLSLPALQTLAIIAYKQPISAPEIQAIRQVEGAGVLQTLLKRKLIAPAGRKKAPGNALLYRTTSLFLSEFGLPDLKALPNLEEFAQIRAQPYLST